MAEDGKGGYREAGVDLDAAAGALELMRAEVESTRTEQVLSHVGSFGGLFALPEGYSEPVLVASTDGVGTKTMVAAAYAGEPGVLEGIGRDLVNHCVNDVLVQGARPIFFLDYLASAELAPDRAAALVRGVARACRAAGTALLGGETAEMPGVYRHGEFDVAGTIVGIVERSEIVDGRSVSPGDLVLGLTSGGLQTNGFSLARRALARRLEDHLPDGTPVWRALLSEHRSFLSEVRPLLEARLVKAMAHVTGGGLPGNLPRSLPDGVGARLHLGSWTEPPIFDLIRRETGVSEGEMRDVFNLGIGFVVVVPAGNERIALELAPSALVIGEVVDGRGVEFV